MIGPGSGPPTLPPPSPTGEAAPSVAQHGVTYFLLLCFTETGMHNIAASPERAMKAHEMIQRLSRNAAKTTCYVIPSSSPGSECCCHNLIVTVTGISEERALQIALALNRDGFVRATLLKGWDFSVKGYTALCTGSES